MMSSLILAQQTDSMSNMYTFLPMLFVIAIFYVMVLRPQQRREKERRSLIESAKKGQRVVFCGGLIGVIANVKEDRFIVKLDENTRVEVLKGAVTQVLEKGEKFEDEAAPNKS